MLSRFSNVLQTAADVLAPPATRVDDFEYHWKLIQNLYVNQNDSIRMHVEATKIPFHLHQILQLLIDEEVEQPCLVGPCLELIINKTRGILDCLSALAEADYPPGIRGLTLTWYTSLLRRIKQPFIHHMSVYQPIQKLLIECNKLPASPTEKEEVELLLTLCGLVRKQPGLANIFTTAFLDEAFKVQEENVPENSPSSQINSSMSTPKRNSLFNFDGLLGLSTCISIVSLSEIELSAINSDKHQILEDSTSSICCDDDIMKKNIKMSFEDNDKFLLMDLLISYLDSADNHIVLRACEGVMIVSSLPDVSIASLITNCSSVCEILVDKLVEKFKLIPANTDPSDVEQLNCTWGFIVQDFTEKQCKWFVGYKEVTTFLSWLDYCDTLMKECHMFIANHLSTTFRRNFLESTVERGLSDYHHTVLVTAVLSKCIRTVDSIELITEISNWLVGEGNLEHWPILHILIENCLSDRHELCLETLRFFETVIEKPTEHVLHRLILCYINGRGYHLSPSKLQTTVNNTWSDEEDERDRLNGVSLQQERERNRELMKDICSGRKSSVSEGWQEYSDSHITSQTIVPEEIHKAVNSFLLLLPRNLLSDPGGVGYEQYVQDAHRQYQCWLEVTSGFHWPSEVTWPEEASSTHSCDSRPEADLHLVHSPDSTRQCCQQKLNTQKVNSSTCRCIESNQNLMLFPNHSSDAKDCGDARLNHSENATSDDHKECLFSQTLVMKSKQRCCLNRTGDDEDNSFDEGPFLRMLFNLVSNMTNQPYQINLQLTSIISKVALLPHPYLHEYLLNTAIPMSKSVNTLYRSLKSVARNLSSQIPKTKNYKIIIEKTRQELLGDDRDDESNCHNSLFESLIVMEEFCKELAAIASIKYHHCSHGNTLQAL